MTLQTTLLLATALFCVGIYGVLTRKHVIAILLSVELMANASSIAFVAFSRWQGGPFGQVFALFGIAITVAEVVVGLALVLLLHRAKGAVEADLAKELRG